MRFTTLRHTFLTGLLLILIGCSAEQESATEAGNATEEGVSLEGTNWQLAQLTVLGGFVFEPDDHSKYVLNFRSGNRLTGTSDCNSITGSWLQDGMALRFDPFATTRSLCLAGSLHNNLILYLKDVNALSLRDGHLILTTPEDGIEIEFESRD
ncbi:MAG: META domain-containing protein [Pseudomonadales bacterium]|nr:META domain-containing protein [Pseudomonadales bacterium]MCP5331321.1 META domain-containing protein [Pseudomonadales bacterium]MCP5344331.1 META domain-containing protein [Pseudomonadales bacterium]